MRSHIIVPEMRLFDSNDNEVVLVASLFLLEVV